MSTPTVDLFIIGGGINGAGVARDAAGRGLSVMLAERGDYACGTSSGSSKLIHGGLRYLETYEFSLVRESLRERETLKRAAPYLAEPLRFLVPITQHQPRPAWMVRIGLKLYDLLAGKKSMGASGRLDREQMAALTRLRPKGVKTVLHYHDCRTDDARLVMAVLLDARERGADIANRRNVLSIEPLEDGYKVSYDEQGTRKEISARYVINAAGPWANEVVKLCPDDLPRRALKLARGSHIVLKMPQPAHIDAYTLQNDDGRVIFTIPWLDNRYLMIGTTDEAQTEDPEKARCSAAERDYLLAAYNRYFAHPGGPATPNDVLWSFSAVRALVDDGAASLSKVTREATLAHRARGNGGFITLYGGKLTTHRVLAQEVLELLGKMGLSMGAPWTATAILPGGHYSRAELYRHAQEGPQALPLNVRKRWAFTYGDKIMTLYDTLAHDPGLAREIAPGVPEAELNYVFKAEDARTHEDFLMRRTKLHLELDIDQKAAIDQWFKQRSTPI